jgi:hypothetical protein
MLDTDGAGKWLARALRGCALWQGSNKFEPNRQKSDQVKPLPFIDSVPREPLRPSGEDDLLLQVDSMDSTGRADGVSAQ